jgi:hypothetical protein
VFDATGKGCQPKVRLLKLRYLQFPSQRGNPKSAQGKRPAGAPPWVETATGFEALKGDPKSIRRIVPPLQGFKNLDQPLTQGVALGRHSVAPLGLKTQRAQLQNVRLRLFGLRRRRISGIRP